MTELELSYNSVEVKQTISYPYPSLEFRQFSMGYLCFAPLNQEYCVETEAAMQAQNEEMMALVMEQYNNMSIAMEEEKKAKLEQLYDQIVSLQENMDSAKATVETTAREAETEARVSGSELDQRHQILPETIDVKFLINPLFNLFSYQSAEDIRAR